MPSDNPRYVNRFAGEVPQEKWCVLFNYAVALMLESAEADESKRKIVIAVRAKDSLDEGAFEKALPKKVINDLKRKGIAEYEDPEYLGVQITLHLMTENKAAPAAPGPRFHGPPMGHRVQT